MNTETASHETILANRDKIIAHLRKGVYRALDYDATPLTEDQYRMEIELLDAPIASAISLGPEEVPMYLEFRSYQKMLEMICDELYPKEIREYDIRLNPLQVGFIRGLLAKYKDEGNTQMAQSVIDQLDPQIERLFYALR